MESIFALAPPHSKKMFKITKLNFFNLLTLESGIDVGQGIKVGYVTKNPSNLKKSVDHGKNSKM